MSIGRSFHLGWIISHEKYINEVYGPKYASQKIFEILTPYRMDEEARRIAYSTDDNRRNRKSRKRSHDLDETPAIVLKAIELISSELRAHFLPVPTDAEIIAQNNQRVRKLVQSLESNEVAHDLVVGKNDGVHVSRVGEVLLPPESAYVQGNVASMKAILRGRQFDVILCDPPWENKHVKRSRTYSSMTNEDIFDSIDVTSFLSEKGIVLIWCTPSSKRHQAQTLEWISKSGLTLISTYYWLKVTASGELIHSLKKKPSYELLYIASKSSRHLESRVMISVPSAIHSHKPPLLQVLKESGLPWKNGLEIFGRYCLPGWTTLGNQVLKLQNIKYFVERTEIDG